MKFFAVIAALLVASCAASPVVQQQSGLWNNDATFNVRRELVEAQFNDYGCVQKSKAQCTAENNCKYIEACDECVDIDTTCEDITENKKFIKEYTSAKVMCNNLDFYYDSNGEISTGVCKWKKGKCKAQQNPYPETCADLIKKNHCNKAVPFYGIKDGCRWVDGECIVVDSCDQLNRNACKKYANYPGITAGDDKYCYTFKGDCVAEPTACDQITKKNACNKAEDKFMFSGGDMCVFKGGECMVATCSIYDGRNEKKCEEKAFDKFNLSCTWNENTEKCKETVA